MTGARWYTRAWGAHEACVNEHNKVKNPLLLCFGADGRMVCFEFRFIYWLTAFLARLRIESNVEIYNRPSFLADPSAPTLVQRLARRLRFCLA
jgi:hypothetical protein